MPTNSAPLNSVLHEWMIYALGGGMGHLTRAISLCRAVTRRNRVTSEGCRIRVSIMTNSPFAGVMPITDELADVTVGNHRVHRLAPDANRRQIKAAVGDLLSETPADTLIVDTFPRGLGGELADWIPKLRCRKVLVHRTLNEKYCEQFSIHEFASHYDRILLPGETGPLASHPKAVVTQPWLIRDSDELAFPEVARKQLRIGTADDTPIAIVLGCGRISEAQRMQMLADRLATEFAGRLIVRFASPQRLLSSNDSPLHIWPMLECLPAVSLIVGSGGYNTVNEARAATIPLLAYAQDRLYDRQQERLLPEEIWSTETELLSRIDCLLNRGLKQNSIRYVNGVHRAVEVIDSCS